MRRWDNHKNKLRSSRKSKINLRLVSVRRMKRSRSSNSNKRSLKSRVSRNRRLRLRNSPLRSKLTSSKKLLPRNISPKANRFLSSKTKWKRRRNFFA
jgi:regulator of replication initiation timing